MDAPIAQAFPPGEFLADELEERGWTQADFAAILGRPAQFVSEIISGRKEITRESAAQIGAALGTTAQQWLNLQDNYLLWKQSSDAKTQGELDQIARRARLNKKGPIALLQKAGVLKAKDLDALEAEVQAFFELDSLDDEPLFLAAAKRSNHGDAVTPLQIAWSYQVRHAARKTKTTGTYSAKALAALAAELPRRVTKAKEFEQLPRMLAEVGVRLVHVPALPGAKIDACAMFVDGEPVIGLSGRGKRLDKVLFALLHEIGHIVAGHVDADSKPIIEVVDVETDASDQSDEARREREANEAAGDWVLPTALPAIPDRITKPWIDHTANALEIAPIVLVGHLQHHKYLDWRTTLVKGAPSVGDVLTRW